MFPRERRKVLCGVLDLHGMRFLACKIDHNLIEEKVPFGHATEPPTLVQTKRARLQLFELLRGFCRKFSRFNKFLRFGIHFRGRTQYDERFRSREKSLRICVASYRRAERTPPRRLQFAIAASGAA